MDLSVKRFSGKCDHRAEGPQRYVSVPIVICEYPSGAAQHKHSNVKILAYQGCCLDAPRQSHGGALRALAKSIPTAHEGPDQLLSSFFDFFSESIDVRIDCCFQKLILGIVPAVLNDLGF